jgi:uncharacterized protein (DUF1697 family)
VAVGGEGPDRVTRFAALLRSINVGGRNRLPMADLRALVESLGFGEVATYLQSGNVVFAGSGSSDAVAQRVGGAITDRLGLTVPVVVRTDRQLARLLSATPYPTSGVDPKTLHVTFLAGRPDAGAVRTLEDEALRFDPDRLRVVGADVFLHCPGGYGETKLNNAFLERRLGVVATTRNWRTVTTLAGMVRVGPEA